MSQIPTTPLEVASVTTQTTRGEAPTQTIVERSELKPGVQTSEFWTSIIVHIVGGTIAIIGASSKNMEMVYTGAGLLGVVQSTYNIGRGLAKR